MSCTGTTIKGTKCRRKAIQNERCNIHQPIDPTYTITFCESSENHVGMEKNGSIAPEGFTYNDLKTAQNWAKEHNLKSDLYSLHDALKSPSNDEKAWVLVIRNFNPTLNQQCLGEVEKLTWDDKYYDRRRKRVLNKRTRHNCCFGDISQKADFKNQKGTIYSFKDLNGLKQIRQLLPDILGPKAKQLLAEGNKYMDSGTKTTGIGFHGDTERRLVIGLRLSSTKETPSLQYRWYYQSKIISDHTTVTLNSGDLYVMSTKAIGTDWRQRKIRTLRHATGATKYTK